jgi:hypothetical protein
VVQIRSASFVIRLRAHPGSPGRWWGEVQRVETGERTAFRDQEKLLAFLQRHLRDLGRPAAPRR